MEQLHALMYYKARQVLSQSEVTFLCSKAGRVVLKSKTDITTRGNFCYKMKSVLQKRSTFITKWAVITK